MNLRSVVLPCKIPSPPSSERHRCCNIGSKPGFAPTGKLSHRGGPGISIRHAEWTPAVFQQSRRGLEPANPQAPNIPTALVDLGSRAGDGTAQDLHRGHRCESLFLRSAQPLAARNERKHQPPAAPIPAEENRPFRLHTIPTGQDRAASKSTAPKNLGLRDSCK